MWPSDLKHHDMLFPFVEDVIDQGEVVGGLSVALGFVDVPWVCCFSGLCIFISSSHHLGLLFAWSLVLGSWIWCLCDLGCPSAWVVRLSIWSLVDVVGGPCLPYIHACLLFTWTIVVFLCSLSSLGAFNTLVCEENMYLCWVVEFECLRWMWVLFVMYPYDWCIAFFILHLFLSFIGAHLCGLELLIYFE